MAPDPIPCIPGPAARERKRKKKEHALKVDVGIKMNKF
jgi:hypothetical protein